MYIQRKPEPLGTEFKCVVDGFSGVMLWMEVQEGKERMRQKEFSSLGGTAACTLRGVKATRDFKNLPVDECSVEEPIRCFYGDSWFGSVKAISNIAKAGHHAVMMIKTSHSRTPKKWLERTMSDMPGGTWIVMEGQDEKENVPLICIGYKYNKKKTLVFLTTRGAGSTTKGEPYEARFPDKYGNLCVRHIARPQVISLYFKYSNVVDIHNQSRQADLSLEKKWVTEDCYFRIYTTILGIIVTDTWKLFKDKHHKGFCKVSISEFSDILAKELLDQAKEATLPVTNISGTETTDTESQVSQLTTQASTIKGGIHTRDFLKGGKQVRCIWCSRVNLVEKKTTLKCLECGKGFCRNHCWSHHVAHGGVPAAPKYGTKKRKRVFDE